MAETKDKELEDLETKLTQLDHAVGKSISVLSAGKQVSIKQHLEALQTTANKTNECRRIAEAFKIAQKQEISEIKEWNLNLDVKLDATHVAIENLQKSITEAEKAEKFETHEEELKREMSLYEK